MTTTALPHDTLHVAWVSLVAGMATGVGALPVLLVRAITESLYQAFVGLSAGVMAVVAVLGLILPGLGIAPLYVLVGTAGGAALVWGLDAGLTTVLSGGQSGLRQGMLLWIAMVLHNIPEGLAIGSAYAGAGAASGQRLGPVLAIAIGLHNLPEGLAVATPLRAAGVSAVRSWATAALAGLAEPLAAAVAHLLLAGVPDWLPAAYGVAAGAMLFVVCRELLPTIARSPRWRRGVWGLVAGWALGMALEWLAIR